MWEFFAKNSEVLYRLALIVAGAIGIPLLCIRTRAANRSANAALEQARSALKQSETAAKRHEEQTAADRERRITESFAKAIEQLGDDKLEVRLGGIYTLERIARESEREYWPIMETLTAYVRERAPWPPKSSGADETAHEIASRLELDTDPTAENRPATDIQAVLAVLGRRDEAARQRDQEKGRRLNLQRTDLRGANLEEAHLEGASLLDAHLKYAWLQGAHLEDANLGDAAWSALGSRERTWRTPTSGTRT